MTFFLKNYKPYNMDQNEHTTVWYTKRYTKTHSKWLMLSQLFLRSIVVIPSKNLHIRLGQLFLKKDSPTRMTAVLLKNYVSHLQNL